MCRRIPGVSLAQFLAQNMGAPITRSFLLVIVSVRIGARRLPQPTSGH